MAEARRIGGESYEILTANRVETEAVPPFAGFQKVGTRLFGRQVLPRAGLTHHLYVSDFHVPVLGIIFLDSGIVRHVLGVFFHIVGS